MRYLSARVCPSKESPVFSRPTPSEGHSVVVSGYSFPHFGHFFIERFVASLPFCLGEMSAYHTASLLPKRMDCAKTNASEAIKPRSHLLLFPTAFLGLNEDDHKCEEH